jgi:hypothetical protein
VSGFGTSRAAIQVCTMNSVPARTSAAIIDLPIDRADSRFSSARVEMPSKPRKLSTAIDTAPKTRPKENVSAL